MKRGTVISTYVDRDADEVRVDVTADVGQNFRDVPFKSPAKGFYYVPEVGDQVILYDEGDGKRAAMHPEPAGSPSPALPDISSGEYAIVTQNGASVVIRDNGELVLDGGATVTINEDGSVDISGAANITINADGSVDVGGDDVTVGNGGGTVTADGNSVVLGSGGTNIIKDISVSTTKDADGHVTSVSLNITRSNVSETE